MFAFLWFLIGYGAVTVVVYLKYNKGEEITVGDIVFFLMCGLAGPLVVFALLILGFCKFMDDNANKVILKKEKCIKEE